MTNKKQRITKKLYVNLNNEEETLDLLRGENKLNCNDIIVVQKYTDPKKKIICVVISDNKVAVLGKNPHLKEYDWARDLVYNHSFDVNKKSWSNKKIKKYVKCNSLNITGVGNKITESELWSNII